MTEFKHILWGDTETYCETPIAAGLHRYAEQVEVMLFQWALDDGEVFDHDFTEDPRIPRELREMLLDPSVQLRFHNAAFDRTVIRWGLGLDIPVERWFCTMAQSYAHSMPGSLDKLGEAQGLEEDQRKLKIGNQLIQMFCKPRPKNQILRRATRITHPVEWAQFRVYGKQDVAQMRESSKRLPTWNYKGQELALWHLDQRINDRGILVDLDLAHGAVETAEREKRELKRRGQVITNGEVESLTKRDQLLAHLLAEYGVDLPDLQKATLERRIDDPDLPEALKELLRMRLDATTTSVAKYKTLLKAVSSDGRLRGLLQFCGAARTGRWAGRIWQPQNLTRPTHKLNQILEAIALTKAGTLDLAYADVMARLSSCVRGSIIAPEGRKLVIADLSNIEGRTLAWLAGEEWKLQAFRDFDAGIGHDLYALAYAKAFGVSPEAVMDNKEFGDGSWRQIGKVMELALGYEGGVGAFLTFAAVYGIDLEAMADQAAAAIPKDVWGEARGMLEWTKKKKRSTYGLSDRAWLVCESFKRLWRYAHPETAAFWKELDETVRQAIGSPGVTLPCRRLKIRRDGSWLRIALPSGRALCYPAPKIDDKGRISYMGTHQYTRKWTRLHTYGGKLCLAFDTKVLTCSGWVAIQQVTAAHKVWDGVEWVEQDGMVCNGEAEVIQAHGAWMTPDHEVLTDEGWKIASQSERYNRAACRLPDGVALPRVEQREEVRVGDALRLRSGEVDGRIGILEAGQEGNIGVLRLHAEAVYRPAEHLARDVKASGVRGVVEHARPVQSSDACGVQELRRAWDLGVPGVGGVVRGVLGGHGADLQAGVDAGSGGQRRELHADKLPLGYAHHAGQEQAEVEGCADALGRDVDSGAVRAHGVGHVDDLLPAGAQRNAGAAGGGARRIAQVYDLVNCGPRNRFVVATPDGPLIVHNCENVTQAAARDVMAHGMLLADPAGYEILLTVHDELITETPDTEDYTVDGLAGFMAAVPDWAPGLPLAAAGFETDRYRKE